MGCDYVVTILISFLIMFVNNIGGIIVSIVYWNDDSCSGVIFSAIVSPSKYLFIGSLSLAILWILICLYECWLQIANIENGRCCCWFFGSILMLLHEIWYILLIIGGYIIRYNQYYTKKDCDNIFTQVYTVWLIIQTITIIPSCMGFITYSLVRGFFYNYEDYD